MVVHCVCVCVCVHRINERNKCKQAILENKNVSLKKKDILVPGSTYISLSKTAAMAASRVHVPRMANTVSNTNGLEGTK